MNKLYHNYVKDLFAIKMTPTVSSVGESMIKLKGKLEWLTDLKSKLRVELDELLKEFISIYPQSSKDDVEDLRDINRSYLRRIDKYIRQINKKIQSILRR